MIDLNAVFNEIRVLDRTLPSHPWYVNKNDLVGGYSIGTVCGKASENRDYGNIADFLTFENANILVSMRNLLHRMAASK